MRTLEQRKEIEELSAQVAELEQLRKKQGRKIHELKSEVDTTIHSSDENRVVADNAVQALSSELRTTKAALMAIQNREKAVSNLVVDTMVVIFRPNVTVRVTLFCSIQALQNKIDIDIYIIQNYTYKCSKILHNKKKIVLSLNSH